MHINYYFSIEISFYFLFEFIFLLWFLSVGVNYVSILIMSLLLLCEHVRFIWISGCLGRVHILISFQYFNLLSFSQEIYPGDLNSSTELIKKFSNISSTSTSHKNSQFFYSASSA